MTKTVLKMLMYYRNLKTRMQKVFKWNILIGLTERGLIILIPSIHLEMRFYLILCVTHKNKEVKLTWSHAKAENVGEDAGHAQIRHPGYMVLFACGKKKKSNIHSIHQIKRFDSFIFHRLTRDLRCL